MNVTVLCVGKLKESYWREACAEYAKRLGAFCKCRVEEVDEERMAENPSPAQIEKVLEAEGERLLRKIPHNAAVFALCIEGKELSSPALAEKIEGAGLLGKSNLVFVIGGSWGLSPQVKNSAFLRLSMSPMTFPHQLARVMVCEQIYRAFEISSGGKYHK